LAAPREKQKNELQIERVNENFWKRLENHIDKYSEEVPELKNFILPGGTKSASLLHNARTVCRRAEREVVAFSKNVEIGQHIVVYLNRLSDLLFVLSRVVNHRSGINDILWQK
jgi:cob(I)alamin adenosyltransferase